MSLWLRVRKKMFWDYQQREDCFPLLKSPFLCVYFLPHTSKEPYDKLNNLLIHSFNKYLLSMTLGTKLGKTTFHFLKEINNYRTSANAINQDCAGWSGSSERQTYFRDRSDKTSLNSQCSTWVLKNEATFSRRYGRRASWRKRRVCVNVKGGNMALEKGAGEELCILCFAQFRLFASCIMRLCSSISYEVLKGKIKHDHTKSNHMTTLRRYVMIRGKTPVGVSEAKPGTQSQSHLVQGDLTCQWRNLQLFPEGFKKTVRDFKEEVALFNVNFSKPLWKSMERVIGGLYWKQRNQKTIIRENNTKGPNHGNDRKGRVKGADQREKEVGGRELSNRLNMSPFGMIRVEYRERTL